MRSRVKLLHVPCKESGTALADVLTGPVSMTFLAILLADPHLRAVRTVVQSEEVQSSMRAAGMQAEMDASSGDVLRFLSRTGNNPKTMLASDSLFPAFDLASAEFR